MTKRESTRFAHAAALLALAVLWVLLWGPLSWGTVVLGLVVAAVVLAVFPLPLPRSRFRVRPVASLLVLLHFLADLATASVTVGWLAVRPRPIGHGRIVDVPLRSSDDLCCTLVAEMTSLVPGTVVIDLDAHTRALTLHILDTCDDARARQEVGRVLDLERRVERALGLDRQEVRR